MTRSRPITFLASAAVIPLVALPAAPSTCSGPTSAPTARPQAACASAWPPLLATGTPTAGTGLTASKLGSITRPGSNQQVTYNGHPLYLFIKDQKPGQVTGQGVTAFGAAWFALTPAGNQASAPALSSGGGGSSGLGY